MNKEILKDQVKDSDIQKWLFEQGHATPVIFTNNNIKMVSYLKRDLGKFAVKTTELFDVLVERYISSLPKRKF
jgi:hypothetical protein